MTVSWSLGHGLATPFRHHRPRTFGIRPAYSEAHAKALCDGPHMPVQRDTAFAQGLQTVCAQAVGIPSGSEAFGLACPSIFACHYSTHLPRPSLDTCISMNLPRPSSPPQHLLYSVLSPCVMQAPLHYKLRYQRPHMVSDPHVVPSGTSPEFCIL